MYKLITKELKEKVHSKHLGHLKQGFMKTTGRF